MKTLLAFLAFLGVSLTAPAMAECKFTKLGDIPIVMRGTRPLIQAKINGQDALLLLDTGAWFNTLTAGGAQKLGLVGAGEDRVKVYGVGGEQKIRTAQVKEVLLGNFVTHDAEFLVAQGTDIGSSDVVGVLGQNHFFGDDLEFDFANKVMRVFHPQGCDKAALAYWSPNFAVSELMGAGTRTGEFVTAVLVNGKRVVAQFDSGAPLSVLTLPRAVFAGIDVKLPSAKPIEALRGFGSGSVPAWVAPFESFSMGEETIKNSRLVVADLQKNTPKEVATGTHTRQVVIAGPDMLLGWDFFQAHRIYMARSQRRMYFTYNGGPVFAIGNAVAKP